MGTGYFDQVQQVISGGYCSTAALAGSTEDAQFSSVFEHYLNRTPRLVSTRYARSSTVIHSRAHLRSNAAFRRGGVINVVSITISTSAENVVCDRTG